MECKVDDRKSPVNLKFYIPKPVALLKRIILVSFNSGDIVADFFCGSEQPLQLQGNTAGDKLAMMDPGLPFMLQEKDH